MGNWLECSECVADLLRQRQAFCELSPVDLRFEKGEKEGEERWARVSKAE